MQFEPSAEDNHDNPVSSNYQAPSHWKSVKNKYLPVGLKNQFEGCEMCGATNVKWPDNDRRVVNCKGPLQKHSLETTGLEFKLAFSCNIQNKMF